MCMPHSAALPLTEPHDSILVVYCNRGKPTSDTSLNNADMGRYSSERLKGKYTSARQLFTTTSPPPPPLPPPSSFTRSRCVTNTPIANPTLTLTLGSFRTATPTSAVARHSHPPTAFVFIVRPVLTQLTPHSCPFCLSHPPISSLHPPPPYTRLTHSLLERLLLVMSAVPPLLVRQRSSSDPDPPTDLSKLRNHFTIQFPGTHKDWQRYPASNRAVRVSGAQRGFDAYV